ncbi:DUF177 domain-containing protein [Parasphingopyxis sp.]|uniref:YceD family protein n=1 Tax=Parasphingopyxis sp. TaxID=1920299 RepID=UPI0026300FB8|nr:DUF177 domain-containing protein [Parasphingopyxis sp.]
MTAEPEFSRRIAIDSIGNGAARHDIAASDAECAALAERFALQSIARLSAHADVHRDGNAIFAKGTVDAEIVQSCVVTGDAVRETIAEAFELRFIPEHAPADEEEIELSSEECETLTYSDGAIDLGEAAAQTMALALDPFPRGANADEALREAGVLSEEEAGPFGALKGLRDQLAAKGE